MARICGIVSKDHTRRDYEVVRDMLNQVGAPTDSCHALLKGEGVCLGACHREQTNTFQSSKVLVVLDGSIYNRHELGLAQSDAELWARLYLQHGFPASLERVNGDFAVAIFDLTRHELWLARDRFGVKPLYCAASPESFAFGSRPRSLLTVPGISPEVNRQFVALFAASHYRYFDNDSGKSPFASIAQLPAGHMLQVRDGELRKSEYWALADEADFTEPEAELAERYSDLLLDSVAIRLKTAERPAFTLSGGMDSSSVLASAVRVTNSKQAAFSTVYKDKTYDETNEIQSMLDAAVQQWHPVRIDSPDVLALVRRMVDAHDEPVATATWLSHFLLCQEASRQGFRALFGGLGGDELNAGEYEYFFFFFADLMGAGLDAELKQETEKWIAHHNHPIYRKSFHAREEGLARLVDLSRLGRCLPDRARMTRYYSALNPDYFSLEDFEPIMDHPFHGYLKNRTFQDIFRETAPCCLRAQDRQTAAFGLENLAPFFDHRLVEFMFRIPGHLKIYNGVTKRLLREAMRGVLPEKTRTRVKKTGWNAPAHIWFSGPGRELLLDLVHSSEFRNRGIYNVAEVCRLIDEHDHIVSSGRMEENHMMFLWQLVNLEMWFQWLDSGRFQRIPVMERGCSEAL